MPMVKKRLVKIKLLLFSISALILMIFLIREKRVRIIRVNIMNIRVTIIQATKDMTGLDYKKRMILTRDNSKAAFNQTTNCTYIPMAISIRAELLLRMALDLKMFRLMKQKCRIDYQSINLSRIYNLNKKVYFFLFDYLSKLIDV